ncbi:MAG: PrsW family glutamic-type intramembrane protease, partial [Patescibacteria group bacterium]
MEINPQTVFIALTGGILPALLWLWFWLKEDMNPEPRGLLLLSFLGGMAVVIVVLPIEKFAYSELKDGILLITAWSAIEEVAKYGAAYFIALKTRFLDEPMDYVIYMITVALGFAALENTLFLISTI